MTASRDRGGAPEPAAALDALCDAVGVERRHESGGRVHEAPLPSVLGALRTLGAPVHSAADASDALRALAVRRRRRLVEPVSVSWEGTAPALAVRVMEAESGDAIDVRLTLEEGSVVRAGAASAEVRWEGHDEADGRGWRSGRVALPADLPPGVHRVTVRVGAREGTGRVVRAPRRAWRPGGETGRDEGGPADGGPSPGGAPGATGHAPREWGAFLPLYALHPRCPTGIADLDDLERLAAWTASRGGSVVGTLPLYAQFLGPGRVEPSPYAPVSRLFWNELHLALERAPGLASAPAARALLDEDGRRRELGALGRAERVDHARVAALRRPVLQALADAVAGTGDDPGGPPGTWAEGRPDALAYARFRAFAESDPRPWREWPGSARTGSPPSDGVDPASVRLHLYAQWAMDRQMKALADAPCNLYLDLPVGSHPDGFDTWREGDLFADGWSGGAPPDAFFRGGQDWGFPPVHPGRARERGHDYTRRCLQRIMAVSGLVRLDHVMSLHRLFWVPRDGGPAEGVYVRYPAEELYALLCLESHRHRCEVIGEDLGVVPSRVRTAMDRHGLLRMWVLPFEVDVGGADDDGAEADHGGPPRDHEMGAGADLPRPAGEAPAIRAPAPGSVASLGTHDIVPFAGFWKGLDVAARVRSGQLAEEDAPAEREDRNRWRRAVARVLAERGLLPETAGTPDGPDAVLVPILRLLGASPARLVLVNLEDLLLEEAPQNEPGTAGPENWTRRTGSTLADVDADPAVRRALEALSQARDDASDHDRDE